MSGAGGDDNGDGGGDAHGGDAMCIVIVLLLLPGLLSRVTHYIIVILQRSYFKLYSYLSFGPIPPSEKGVN